MNELPISPLDPTVFQRVWRRVMPEDRADCPFTPEEPAPEPKTVQPPQPFLPQQVAVTPQQGLPPSKPTGVFPCLGEESVGELPLLEGLIDSAALSRKAYRALERQWHSSRSPFSSQKSSQIQRLQGAYYLISGKSCTPNVREHIPVSPGAKGIRERFRAEQRDTAALMDAAQTTSDPCLARLFRELAEENRQLADLLQRRLASLFR